MAELKKEDTRAVLLRARQQRTISPEKSQEKQPSKTSTAQRKVNALRMLRSLNNNIAQRSKTIAKNAAKQYSKAMNKVKNARNSSSEVSSPGAEDDDRGNTAQFEPRLDFEILGVRTRDVTIAMSDSVNGRAREDDSFNLDGVGICIQKSERAGEVGVLVIEIHPTGTAAAGGNVYVGDVILEVNGKLMLYKDPADIIMEMVSSTEEINMKLAAARDLRVALFSGDDVDPMGTAVDGDTPSTVRDDGDSDATASILACLAQIGGNAIVPGGGDGDVDNARLLDEWLQSTIATVEQGAAVCDDSEGEHRPEPSTADPLASETSAAESARDEESSMPDAPETPEAAGDDSDACAEESTEDVVDSAALDLLLTPKSVADQLSAKDAAMAQMQAEMDAMRQAQEQRTTEATELHELLARQREAERAEKLVAARRLQSIRNEIAALPPPHTREDVVDHAVRESSLMEQVRLLEGVINAPTAFPLTANEIASEIAQSKEPSVPTAHDTSQSSETPEVVEGDHPAEVTEESNASASHPSTPDTGDVSDASITKDNVAVAARTENGDTADAAVAAIGNSENAAAASAEPENDPSNSIEQPHVADTSPTAVVKHQPLDAGVVVSGSKFHKECMGTYECAGTANGRKFWELKNKDTFLYFLERNWRVGKDTTSEKCVLRTHSMAQRPDKAKSVWYEAQGIHSIMTGNPAIHVTRDTSGSSGGPPVSAGAGSAVMTSGGAADSKARRKASQSSQQTSVPGDGKDTGKHKAAKRVARRKQDTADAAAKQEQQDRSQAIQAAKAEASKRSREMAAKRRASMAKDTSSDTAEPSKVNSGRGKDVSGGRQRDVSPRNEDNSKTADAATTCDSPGPGWPVDDEGSAQRDENARSTDTGPEPVAAAAVPTDESVVVPADSSATILSLSPAVDDMGVSTDTDASSGSNQTSVESCANVEAEVGASDDTAVSAQALTAPAESTIGSITVEKELEVVSVELSAVDNGAEEDLVTSPATDDLAHTQTVDRNTLQTTTVNDAADAQSPVDVAPIRDVVGSMSTEPVQDAAHNDAAANIKVPARTQSAPQLSIEPQVLPKVEEWKSMNRFLVDKLEAGHEVDVVSLSTNEFDGTTMAEPLTASSSDDPETAPQADDSITNTETVEHSPEDSSDTVPSDDSTVTSPDGLIVKAYHMQQKPGDHGFGFQILAPKHGEMGITMLKVHDGGAASRSGLVVGDVVVCIGKILVLYQHTLGTVSRAMASETTTDSRGNKQCQITCCTKYDLMEWLMSNQSTDALFQRSARMAQNQSSVSNLSTEGSVSCLSESDADFELAPFAKTVPSQIDLLEQVRSKMCGQLEQASELDLNDEECMVMSEEVARLGEQIEELEMRPKARLVTIRRCNAPDGRSLGFRFLKCPRENTAMVQHVEEGGAADAAGLRDGQYILEVSGRDTVHDSVEDIFKKLNDCDDVVELGTASRARVIPLPHKARRLTAREQFELMVDEFKAAPDLKSFFFGGKSGSSVGDRAGSPRRTTSAGSVDGKQSPAKQALLNAVQDAESRINDVKHKWRQIVVDEDGKKRMVYKSIGGNSSRGPKVASNRELLFGCAIKRVSLRVKSVEAAGFGLRLKMSTTGKRLVEVESIDASSPLIAEDFEVEVGDVLLAVDDTLLCMDLASVTNANSLLVHAEVPCTLCFVAARWVTRLPDTDVDRLRDLIKQTTLRGLWTQARKWYKEQEVREQQQPSIHAMAKLDVEARLPEDGPEKSLKLQTCTVCRTAKKEVVLGCGHSICNMCSKRTHMCPIRGCSRIIMSRKPIQHLFRSNMDEKMYRVGCATSKKGQLLGNSKGSSMDTLDMNPINMTPHASEERKRDSGQGTIAGSWKVAKTLDFEEDGSEDAADGQRTTIVKKRKHGKKKRKETRVVDVVEYTRGHNALPAQRATFDDFTEV
eukprot:m.1437459 g.1437459  ORF g.1437459 m.1437459 type:complete len:1923 (-) comp25087_c0_seq5:150-5918(-)